MPEKRPLIIRFRVQRINAWQTLSNGKAGRENLTSIHALTLLSPYRHLRSEGLAVVYSDHLRDAFAAEQRIF